MWDQVTDKGRAVAPPPPPARKRALQVPLPARVERSSFQIDDAAWLVCATTVTRGFLLAEDPLYESALEPDQKVGKHVFYVVLVHLFFLVRVLSFLQFSSCLHSM